MGRLVGPAFDDPGLAYSYEVRDGLTIINFDRVNNPWFYYDANSFTSLGVIFDPLWVVHTLGGYSSPYSGWSGIFRTPATSGEWALSMGSWEQPGWPYPKNITTTWSWRFPRSVSDLSFNVRPHGDFDITCYDEAGAATDSRRVAGIRNVDGSLRIPVNDWYLRWSPYPVHHVAMRGSIARCVIISNGGILDDFSFRRAPQAGVALDCAGDLGSNRVTRGKEIVCTARKNPATATGELTVTGWSFDGTARSDGDPASLEWRGVMVRGGMVQVKAKVGSGPEQSASATIEVVNRDWPDVPVMHTVVEGATGGDSRAEALPAEIRWASDLGGFYPFPGEPPVGEQGPGDPITDVQGGPNDGLYYFADLTFPVWATIRINDAVMRQGSAFYNAQERPGAGGGTQIGGQRWCSHRVVTSVLPGLVRAHEERHEHVYRQRYGEVVRAVLPELERLTGTYGDLADRYDPVGPKAHQEATAASWAIHDLDGNPNVIVPSEGGRQCNLKNDAGTLLMNPPREMPGS